MTDPRGGKPRCWVCGSAALRPWRAGVDVAELRARDLHITDARYGVTLPLARCAGCGFVLAPDAERVDLAALYAALDDDEYVRTRAARRRQMRALVRRVQRLHPPTATLLDVGAGIGLLVAEARRLGIDAAGVEPSVPLAAHARAAGVPVHTGTLPHPDLGDRRFDAVMLVDVLEHVTAPVALLQRCADRLAPDGVLAVVTPDVRSAAARALRRRWWHFRIAHVGYFSARTLRRAATAAGLVEVSRARPVWYLPLGYLAARLQVYLPAGPFLSLARSLRPVRRLGSASVPLDLRDSLFVVFRRPPSATPPHP